MWIKVILFIMITLNQVNTSLWSVYKVFPLKAYTKEFQRIPFKLTVYLKSSDYVNVFLENSPMWYSHLITG